MILPDFVAEAATGAAAAPVNIGNFIVAEWASTILGFRPSFCTTVSTPGESGMWTWQLQSNEVKGMLPIDFVGQPVGAHGIAANNDSYSYVNHYQPLNITPIYGGETVAFWVDLEDANAGDGQAAATVWYGQPGDQMPAHWDPLPGTQRYGLASPWTAAGAIGARSGVAQFNVVGGESIIRVDMVMASAAASIAGDAITGQFELQSTGFASSPMRFTCGSVTPAIVGTGEQRQAPIMTRDIVYMPIDRYCVIDAYHDSNATAFATDYWQVDVEFLRPGE